MTDGALLPEHWIEIGLVHLTASERGLVRIYAEAYARAALANLTQEAATESSGSTAALAELGLWVLEQTRNEHIGSDLNGGDIQDKAEALGLLAHVEVTEPCGENCHCAEYDDFPQQCLRYSWATKAARAA